jgi:hypothetical protein
MFDFVKNLPIQSIVSGVIAGRFWFTVSCCLLILLIVQPYLVVNAMKTNEKIITVNPTGGDLIYSEAQEWKSAKDLYEFCTKKAVTAYVMRNPKGLDDPELAEATFNSSARSKIKSDLEKQSTEFAEKQIHQKGEIISYDYVNRGVTEVDNEDGTTSKTDVIEARVEGQLIRNGIQRGIEINQKLHFRMVLTMVRNKSLKTSGMFPLVTTDYTYEERTL